MAQPGVAPGQIWQDDCYYLDRDTGACQRKYVLILAVAPGGSDSVTAVFTTKSHGLVEQPPCSLGPPRAGYYVGVPGGRLPQPSWVDFSSVQTFDHADLTRHVRSGRTRLLNQTLAPLVLCAVLRCVSQSPDITGRQAKWIADIAATLRCP